MQLEQQEMYEIKGPQLQVLGEVESKLPAAARRRPVAGLALVLAIAIAVFGIGGARLKGAQGKVLERFTAADGYGNSIQNDFNTQADAAASMIRLAGDVLGDDHSEVVAAQQALDRFAPPPQAPDAAYSAERQLYSAIDGLYNIARLSASGDKAERIEELYAVFASLQGPIDRAGAQYNEAARAYNKTLAGFPANIIGALWGADEVPLYAVSDTGTYGEADPHHDAEHHG